MNKIGTITVVNRWMKQKPDTTHRIYIGRPGILGNPFVMRNETDRKRAVDQYRPYLIMQYAKQGAYFKAIEDIALLVLQGAYIELECYCAPKACHGDVIKGMIEIIVQENTNGGE